MFSEEYYRVRHHEAFKEQFLDPLKDPSAPVYAHWLERIEMVVGRGRLLDVGSALGTFLVIARKRGWSVQGVEISSFSAEYARKTHGLSVHCGDLQSVQAEDGSFDSITFWDSIEHVQHPLENLVTAVRLTRPGGVLLFTTDNFDCLVADIARWAYRLSGGRFRYGIERVYIDRNRSYFTESTFRKLLEQVGLRILLVEKMEYPIDKIQTTAAERLLLKGLYGLARMFHREAQITVLATRA